MPASPIARFRSIALGLTTAALLGSLPSPAARAQAPDAAPAPAAPAAAKADVPAPTPPPAAAFAARDKLIAYVEFDGLDAHEDAWRKTAAYRMLNDTPLGAMLEEVGVALLDRAALWLPNRKINGADGVAIVKHLARKGFVAAFHADPSAPDGYRGVLVLRGATTKEEKGLLSRLVVSFMDPASKFRLERKGTRSIVVVPPPDEPAAPADPAAPAAPAAKPAADAGWAWWAEGGDFGIALARPSDAEACLASVDGKVESAVGFEPVTALAKPDDVAVPVLKAFLDQTAGVKVPGSWLAPGADSGVRRVEYRWGFQDEALVSSIRLDAPKPRRGALAFLDEPSFEAKKTLAVPDGVEYLGSISVKPDRWPALIAETVAAYPDAKARYDALAEGVKGRRIDFEKDFLAGLGPRAVVYLAPNTSAAADEPPAALNLTDPMALLYAMGPQLPRPVIVAEVADPSKFSRALEVVIQEANHQLKAATAEYLAEAVKAAAANPNPGGGFPGAPGGPGFPGAPGGDHKDRKKDEDAPPEFRLLPSTGATTNRTYMLNVPTSSSIKLPPGFRPSIRLDGNHVAFSTSSEAARAAVEQLKDKGWAPSEDLAQAVERVPDSTFLLLFGDYREATSAALASLPGAIQSGVNTAIAASDQLFKAQAAGGQPGAPGMAAGPGGPGGRGGYNPYAPGGPGNMGGVAPGGSGPPQSSSMMMMMGGPPGMGGPQGDRQAAKAGPDFSMIQVRVDPAKLPKADDLKSMMFPSTSAASVDGDSIRIVTRGSFPDATALVGAKGVLPALLTSPLVAARAAAAAKEAKDAEAAKAGQPGQGGPSGAPGMMQPPGAASSGGPGGPPPGAVAPRGPGGPPGPGYAPGPGAAPGPAAAPGGKPRRRDE